MVIRLVPSTAMRPTVSSASSQMNRVGTRVGPIGARSPRARYHASAASRWFADSPLEGDGFELLVPRYKSGRAVPFSLSRPLYTGTESLLTHRWREMDS